MSIPSYQADPDILFVAAVDAEVAGLPEGARRLITGIGTLPAAITLTEYLSTARAQNTLPQRVVNLGTAGGLRDGLDGVFEIERVTKHDFHLQVLSDIERYLLPRTITLPTSGDHPTHSLATGDMFVSDTATRTRLARDWGLCDMEGYAIAAVCQRFDVPVTLLKQVSDPANESSVGAWDGALSRAARELLEACVRSGFITPTPSTRA
ncbi:nucleosidase [Corynebacterium lizhenjunii]|uniref:nucleosidase n=1 Tax=Corynebacterium lizhenjunii TaxID=2709394 RepID=UPI001F2A5663|nr:nucleosidase [Corynebacterium lizhenjunii]